MKNTKIQLLCKVSLLAALAAIIMLFDFPLPFTPPFYKIDFSEVFVLLAGFALGPIAAVSCEALKIVLNLLLNGSETAGIGELANFIMGCSFILPATIYYHKHKTKIAAMKGLLLSTVSLCIVAALTNYFILLPVYAYFFNMPLDSLIAMGTSINPAINNLWGLILLAVIPFNILKGALNSIVVLIIYKSIRPILKKSPD